MISAVYDMPEEYRSTILEASDWSGYMVELEGLEQIDDDPKEKAIHIGNLIRAIRDDIALIKNEEDRLKKRRQLYEQNEDQLKEYLKAHFLTYDLKAIDDGTYTISLRKSPSKVVVDSEKDVPDKYKSEKTVITVNKKDLKKLLEEDGDQPYAYLITDWSVVIS